MPEITLIEGRSLVNQCDEQLNYYRDLLFKKAVRPTPEVITEVSEEPGGSTVREEVMPEGEEQTMSSQQIMDKMDNLYAKRNQIQVAMSAFESTQTFQY